MPSRSKSNAAVETERRRIARDLHDQLGSHLTRLMLLGTRVQEGLARNEGVGAQVGRLVALAREAAQSLDEIVWAVDPENDTADGLVAWLNQYANRFFEDTGIACRLEMPAALPAVVLAPEVRHQLFLLFKEALNNVLKHSQASEVHIRVVQSKSEVEIEVRDNGSGFDAAKRRVGRQGHGLQNMRKRAENIGGRLSIASASGQGTRLKITYPTAG